MIEGPLLNRIVRQGIYPHASFSSLMQEPRDDTRARQTLGICPTVLANQVTCHSRRVGCEIPDGRQPERLYRWAGGRAYFFFSFVWHFNCPRAFPRELAPLVVLMGWLRMKLYGAKRHRCRPVTVNSCHGVLIPDTCTLTRTIGESPDEMQE